MNDDVGARKHYNADLNFCSIFLECWMKLVCQRGLWKVKISIFHCVMITKYILSGIGGRLGAEASMLLMVSLIPFGDRFVTAVVYWTAIITETVEMMVQTWMKLHPSHEHKALRANKLRADAAEDNITRTQWSRTYVPLPKKLMVLSGVQLEQHFVAWLMKLGCRFVQFFDIMHKIGIESLTMFKSLQSQSKKVYGKRANTVWKLCSSLFCGLALQKDKSMILAGDTSSMQRVDTNISDGRNHNFTIERAWTSDFSSQDESDAGMMSSNDKDSKYQSSWRCLHNCGAKAKPQVGYSANAKITTHDLPSCCLTAVPPVVTLTNSSTKDEVTNANVDFDEARDFDRSSTRLSDSSYVSEDSFGKAIFSLSFRHFTRLD